MPPHRLGQRAAVFVAHVARGRADQARDRELLHVLRHVDADERLRVGEEELGQRAGQLGLADAGGAAENERADRALGILEPGAAPPDGPRHRPDGLVLAHHGEVDLVLHAEQPGGFGLLQPGERNAGPAATR